MNTKARELHANIVALKEDIARLEADRLAAVEESKSKERDVKLAEEALSEARRNEQTLYNAIEHRHGKLKYLYRDFFEAMALP